MQVLVSHGRRQELQAFADAGYHLESCMHDSFRCADDGLSCSMYDVLRLYLVLNQLLHNEWDVLECLQWPSDDTLPGELQGLLDSKDSIKKKLDKLAHMPPEQLMKLMIGSQLHWLGSMHADLQASLDVGGEKLPEVRPQFAMNAAWINIGERVRDRTITNADVRKFCEEQLLSILVTTGYILAYDRKRLAGKLPLSEQWEEFVAQQGCWTVGSTVYQVMHLDMMLSILRPRRAWAGYQYYNDRAPLRFESFA